MSLQFENLYTDIFTQPDNSIDSDGSIDPLGLLMIWTSLGNRVFHNRLNTVSTNIHFYTLNLFHHAIICELEETHIDKIVNLTGKAPYDNRNDLCIYFKSGFEKELWSLPWISYLPIMR